MKLLRTKRIRRVTGLGVIAATAAALALTAQPATAAEGQIRGEGSLDAISDSYIVVLEDGVDAQASGLHTRYGGTVTHLYRAALNGFAVTMPAAQARKLAADPAVKYVEQDRVVRGLTDQPNPPSWGIDRIDQRDLPLNSKYSYATDAGNVTAYVIDSGINFSHEDFGGRATFGHDVFNDGKEGKDCHGHGTHVAGTIGGAKNGVAKGVKLKAVRVLDCYNSGSVSGIAAGIDWVTANAVKPAVANLSLYTGKANDSDTSVDEAVRKSMSKGITYVIAAGNFNDDSCQYSPQRVTEAINVGATSKDDGRASFSSYGKCTDLFAPGKDIISASYSNNSGSATMSGTSMAAPHGTGAAALYLAGHPDATPQQVRDALVNNASTGKVTNPGAESPNTVLYTGFIGGDPQPGEFKVTNPGNQTSTVGKAVSLNNSASGGTTPYTWSATGLPAGLSIDSSTGTVSGKPSTEGTTDVTLTAKDSNAKAGSASFTWTVRKDGSSGPVTVTNPGRQNATVGKPVSLQIQAGGGTGSYNYKVTGLPEGLSIDAATGLISGTPSTWGFRTSTVTVTDSAGVSANVSFDWFVWFA